MIVIDKMLVMRHVLSCRIVMIRSVLSGVCHYKNKMDNYVNMVSYIWLYLDDHQGVLVFLNLPLSNQSLHLPPLLVLDLPDLAGQVLLKLCE